MQIITISGQARVGKTTTAKIIAEQAFRLGFIPMFLPFAKPIKDLAESEGINKDDSPEEYREYCQNIGKAMRDKDINHWIKSWAKDLQKIKQSEFKDLENEKKYWERVIISDDCRYLNELSRTRKLGASQIFITAGKRSLPEANATWRSHESEQLSISKDMGHPDYQDLFTTIIVNENTKENLESIVSRRIRMWLGLEIHDKVCLCELCKARREDRLPDIDVVIDDLIDRLFGDFNEET